MVNVYVKTYGCSLNRADSERIKGVLSENGFNIVDIEDFADIIIINSCTVKTPTVNKIKRYIKDMKEKSKKVILAGCIPQAQPDLIQDISMIGPSQIENIVPIVEETLNANSISLLVEQDDDNISLPLLRKNDVIEIVPISKGCLGEPCSYCMVKNARGHLRSYPVEKIVKRIRKAVTYDRVKEIWLTSQDNGCYGYDMDKNITDLLDEIFRIKEKFFIRLGMANPNHVLENLKPLIKAYKNEKMFKFLHVPLQSGSDTVLKNMKRRYKAKDFIRIVDEFRKNIPDITIATDVISGFPEETEKDFKDTLDLIKKVRPDVLNMSKFWLRPGTEAEKLKQLPGETIKQRSRLMSEVFDWILAEVNKPWLNRTCDVIIDEIGKNNTMIARNQSYKPVILDKANLGDMHKVKITKTFYHDLYGQII